MDSKIFQKKFKNAQTTNIYGIQANDSIMCLYFCFEFIDFMLKRERLLDYTNLFSPKEYEKNNRIILKYF